MTQRLSGQPVAGIAPVDGWSLFSYIEGDSDGFTTTGYFACREDRGRVLNVSRFSFTPTQERFEWLVQNSFPAAPRGSWTDAEIDTAMAAPRGVHVDRRQRLVAALMILGFNLPKPLESVALAMKEAAGVCPHLTLGEIPEWGQNSRRECLVEARRLIDEMLKEIGS